MRFVAIEENSTARPVSVISTPLTPAA